MGWKDRPYYQEDNGGIPPVVFNFPRLTKLTMGIIGACLLIFIVQKSGDFGETVSMGGALTLEGGKAFTQPWRWITYQYLHGGAGHFFFNMLALYFFLPTLEMLWGWKKALAFYTLGGIAAGVVYCLLALTVPMGKYNYLIGASGSVLAAMGAVALLSPNRQLILLIFPVPIRVAVALIGAFYLLSALADRNLSDAAHLGGLGFGFFAPYLAGPTFARFQRKWHKQRLQRAVVEEQHEQEEIDRILAKVSQHGMHSLSRREKNALKKATERQRQRDEQMSRY